MKLCRYVMKQDWLNCILYNKESTKKKKFFKPHRLCLAASVINASVCLCICILSVSDAHGLSAKREVLLTNLMIAWCLVVYTCTIQLCTPPYNQGHTQMRLTCWGMALTVKEVTKDVNSQA